MTMLYRLGWDVGMPLEEAEGLGWIRCNVHSASSEGSE
jgi:hypothetical protein